MTVMSKPRNAVLLFSVVLASFLAGHWLKGPPANETAIAGGRRILYYHDPMHPAYKSDKPGIAPDCGMKLEPVYADEGVATQGSQVDPPSLPPGTVQVNSEKQQLIGVQLAAVEKTPGSLVLRTVGRVTANEDLIHRVVAGTDGWVRELIPGGTTGSVVQKDQLLATTYNRELLTAEQSYFYTLNLLDGLKTQQKDSPEQVAAAKAQVRAQEDNLHALGMSDVQMQELAKSRKVSGDMAVRAPVTGLIVARATFPGLRFEKGTELYRLVDLSRVWVLADLFENETQYIRPGTTARVTIPHQHKTFTSRASDVPPQFDPNTRTLKVRLEADNPGFVLRPDMFVDVELPVSLPAGDTVPAGAILDSGLKKTVFVDRGNGYFEPRVVETGWRYGDRVEIVKGLAPSERIVVSGNFLIDSESRMKLAAAGMHGASETGETAETAEKAAKDIKDPVCGMDVDAKEAAAAGKNSTYRRRTYYFCSDHCKKQFDQDPARYRAGKK
jgi:membrane fusion protein, copper/silver efflux system